MLKVGIKYKSDKLTHHGYNRFYDMFLVPLRNQPLKFLEIGIYRGKSLKMWNDFFTNGKIYGLDINEGYEHPKGKVYKGDQSDIRVLEVLVKEIGRCKVIIDDGSHVPEHQLLGFNYLFDKCLDYGGVYIIEDIETSYWGENNKKSELYGYNVQAGFKKKNNIVEIFKNVADIVNREFLLEKHLKTVEKSPIDIENLKYISMITFGGNCVIIKKMTQEEYKKYGNREYRFKDML